LPSEYFRAGVGAILRNETGQVLAFERSGIPGAWQLPQGGLEEGEEPADAVYREIAEETGLRRAALRLAAEYPGLLAYELPVGARRRKTGRGQVQYWFLFDVGSDVSGDLRLGREFGAWRWTGLGALAAETVAFRRPVYRALADWAATVARAA